MATINAKTKRATKVRSYQRVALGPRSILRIFFGALTNSSPCGTHALSKMVNTACKITTYDNELSSTKNNAMPHTHPNVGIQLMPMLAAIWSNRPIICVTISCITFSRNTKLVNVRDAKMPSDRTAALSGTDTHQEHRFHHAHDSAYAMAPWRQK